MRLKQTALCAVVGAIVFAAHAVSPITQSADSRWAVPAILSLVERGDLTLDEYNGLWTEDTLYGIECIGPGGELRKPALAGCPELFHAYPRYPIATPVLSIPLFVAIDKFTPMLPGASPGLQLLQQRMYLQSHRQLEILIASATVALAAMLIFSLGGGGWQGLFWALSFAFGTSLWSTASRAIWQHGMSVLLILAALWLLVDGRRYLLCAGVLLGLAVWNRPLNVIALVSIAIWLRRDAVRLFAGAAIASIPFAVWCVTVYRMPLQPYFLQGNRFVWDASRFGGVLLGQLFSPGRGLLVYSPFLTMGIVGMWRLWRKDRWLAVALALWIGGHTLVICLFDDWAGGFGYGPRYWTDMLPAAVMLMRGEWPMRRWMIPLLLWAVLVHARGAIDPHTQRWNQRWVSGQTSVWDWGGAPFLGGITWRN